MRSFSLPAAVATVIALAACGGSTTPLLPAPPTSRNAPNIASGPPAATITEIAIPTSLGAAQGGIALAPDGTVYASVGAANAGVRYSNGTFTGVPFIDPTQESYASGPVTTSSAGTAFFAIQGHEPADATMRGGIQSFAQSGSAFSLYSAFTTVDAVRGDIYGNVWASVNNGCRAGSCLIKFTGNDPNNFQLVQAGSGSVNVISIAADGSGGAWISLTNATLEHFSPALALLSTRALPAGTTAAGLARASDGSLWWADPANNDIGELINGSVHTYPVTTPNAGLGATALGGDGALWFTEAKASKIGRIDRSTGEIAEYATPTPNAYPTEIAGPNGAGCNPGALWFVEASASKIAKITIQ